MEGFWFEIRYTLRNTGTEAVTGAVPFFKRYMFVQKGSIIGTLKEHIGT